MNQPFPTENQEPMQEELVAYLDGELEPAESERVEKRLSEDPKYQAQLQELQQAWDMLDLLPRAQVGDVFTQSTVETVALKVEQETVKRLRFGRMVLWLGVVAASVVAGSVGHKLVYQRLDEPNRQLLEDLPVVENVDLYYHADDIEFVEKLAASGVFDEEVEPVDYVPQD